jgi:A/G-specific adenine glycosylase
MPAARRTITGKAVSPPSRMRGSAGPLRSALLAWYDRSQRELPWRSTRDPWAILVSEIMLQQTTVTAALPYYERFLQRWPGPGDLAHASTDELLAAWSGLGYYRRAHNLKRAACIVAEAGGTLPGDAAGLAELPGVGRYTAAAVASIAFGERVPAVDGNVERVVCRLAGLDGEPRRAATRRAIEQSATGLIDARRAGDSNQALMELGATICRPRAPRCGECPLARGCHARAEGEPERYPQAVARPTTVDVLCVAALARRGRRVLLNRRAAEPNAGFLELPQVELRSRDRPASARLRRRLASHLARHHGLDVELAGELPVVRHSITHHRIRVRTLLVERLVGRVRPPLLWADPQQAGLPVTTATRRVLQAERETDSAGATIGDGTAKRRRSDR